MIDKKTYSSLLYLWNKRTFYIGPLFEPIAMKNGAGSVAFSLNGTMKVSRLGDHRLVECKSFLVPPGIPFKAYTGDAVIANCMLDELGLDFAVLLTQMQQRGKDARKDLSFQIKDESTYIDVFKDMYRSQYDSTTAAGKIDHLFTPPERLISVKHYIDPRIVEVISLIKQNIEHNLSIEFLAESVNISVPHLVRLFKAQTGVPIRRFRLWHRIFVASVWMAKTGDLTSAALNAGFSDASHFLHTFQDMVGMRASLLLNQPNQINIMTELGS
jgi:AraC-like DNA-binding protein